MKIMFTFPGQGAQYPGMLQHLPQRDAWLARAAAVLGDEEVARLDSAQALTGTRAVQLCGLISGVAWAEALQARGVTPQIVSGLSIGAFPATVVAGALAFEDALRLVALRGDLMAQAWPQGFGLTAIGGLSLRQVQQAMAGSDTWLANLNAEFQTVIAGSDAAMAAVAAQAQTLGATRVQRLAVSVPSHCPLLDEPAARLAQAFEQVTVQRPTIALLSGTTARVIWQPEAITQDLAFNMARTVHWHETMMAAEERDVRLALEMPPGNVLTCLARQTFREAQAISLEHSGLDVACHLAAAIHHDS